MERTSSSSRLSALLSAVPGTSPPLPVQQLLIRTHRVRADFDDALNARRGADRVRSSSVGLEEAWTRLRGRLEELESALTAGWPGEEGGGRGRSHDLAREVRAIVEELEKDVREASVPSRASQAGGSHSRASSGVSVEDLPRRAPRRSDPLEDFLATATPPTAFPSSSESVARHAKALTDAFTLHLLANTPSSVLPPGTSLASLFQSQAASTPSPTKEEPLVDKVRETLQNAYFDQFAEVLSSTASQEVKGSKWGELKRDLWEACSPLIPARMGGGEVKRNLETDLTQAPTSFDLPSAILSLFNLLSTLAKLCAPARDPEVTSLLSTIPDSRTSGPFTSLSPSQLVAAVRATLKLAEEMGEDVAAFKARTIGATASDEELKHLVGSEAARRERLAVRTVYGEDDSRLISDVVAWVKARGGPEEEDWRSGAPNWRLERIAEALVEALFDTRAVALPTLDLAHPTNSPLPPPPPSTTPTTSPPSSPNTLPPIFLVTAPRLFRLQNLIQALTILACLSSLAALPSSPSLPPQPSWIDRLWTILESSIDTSATDPEGTKLEHIVEELLAAVRNARTVDGEEEARLRAGVHRILRYEDPVYRLLSSRAKTAIKEALLRSLSVEPLAASTVPVVRSGRRVGWGLGTTPSAPSPRRASMGSLKGFEKIAEKVEGVEEELERLLDWCTFVWGELLE